jgi:hypothetical protein
MSESKTDQHAKDVENLKRDVQELSELAAPKPLAEPKAEEDKTPVLTGDLYELARDIHNFSYWMPKGQPCLMGVPGKVSKWRQQAVMEFFTALGYDCRIEVQEDLARVSMRYKSHSHPEWR